MLTVCKVWNFILFNLGRQMFERDASLALSDTRFLTESNKIFVSVNSFEVITFILMHSFS